MEVKKLKIYEYLDFRKFIGDFLELQKSEKKGFSKRLFTQLIGMNSSSSSFISAVIKGSRNLTPGLRIKFAQAMKLSDKESLFFDLLVQFNQSRSMEEKNFFFKQLSCFRGSHAKLLKENQFKYYSEWYHSAVWNFFGYNQSEKNPDRIAAKLYPRVTAKQVEQSITLLLDLGLITRLANGYRINDPHITTAPEVRSLAARDYVKTLTKMGLEALDKVPPARRQYNTLMFHVSEKGFNIIKERIQQFQEELRDIINSDENEDRIYTMATLLFPNSDTPEG